MRDVVIVAAKRSAIGKFGGAFKQVSAVELGTQVLKSVLNETNLKSTDVDEVIIGNVLSVGLGQNIARQIAINAGLDESVSAFCVNKVCGSGLKAIMLGAQSIATGDNDIVVVGGSENMSQAPYLLKDERFGKRMGNSQVVDSLLNDGLTDAFEGIHMGVTAENIARKYHITRAQQDEFALASQIKAQKAIETDRFKQEIVPITDSKGQIVDTDEFPRFNSTLEALNNMKPAFEKDGTVTAGTSSGINDGAAMLVLMTREEAQKRQLAVLATIEGFASAGVDPSIMGIGPVQSTRKLLDKLHLSIDDIDLVEANEAFAVQSIAVIQELKIPVEKVNVNGGAIALGHPIGTSGARIVVTLLHEMARQKATRGLATLCIGGGQGVSMVLRFGE